jgi:UDP-N-acetylmuramoyl-tripeptide--D-alanyl-D-alanine ligase
MATAIPKNRARFTIDEIASATAGTVVRSGDPSIGVCTDSRAVDRDAAFVALAGERFDGHAFLSQAAAAGARTLVVSRDVSPVDASTRAGGLAPSAIVRVADTRRALGDLARAHRRRWQQSPHPAGPRSVIAITGSAGKTTTKTVLASLLETLFPGAVHATKGNLNNDVGVPMTVFGLEPEHRFGVFELGTSSKGEIARLAHIAEPDVAVLTLVAPAHTEHLGSIDDVAIEKGALLAGLAEGGLAVVNADDPRAVAQLGVSRARRSVTYGFSAGADYRIVARESHGFGGSKIALARPSGELHADHPLLGDAGALAVAAAIAVVEGWLGAQSDLELERALGQLPATGEGRLAPSRLDDGTWIIDDSYNANPASMRSSIATASELATREGRRLVLVLGEMRELGSLSASEHAALGRLVAATDAAWLVGVGGDAARLVAEVNRAGMVASFAPSADEAIPAVLSRVQSGDLVLVKGSRGVATEKVVRALEVSRRTPSGQRSFP